MAQQFITGQFIGQINVKSPNPFGVIRPVVGRPYRPAGRIILPPQMTPVAYGENYRLVRSTANYFVTIRIPIVMTRKESERIHRHAWAEALNEITLDRAAALNIL